MSLVGNSETKTRSTPPTAASPREFRAFSRLGAGDLAPADIDCDKPSDIDGEKLVALHDNPFCNRSYHLFIM